MRRLQQLSTWTGTYSRASTRLPPEPSTTRWRRSVWGWLRNPAPVYDRNSQNPLQSQRILMVEVRGFEPLTSSVRRKLGAVR